MDLRQLRDLGLYDPDASNAAERKALLEFLLDQGVGVEEMVDAARTGRLVGLVGDRILRPRGARLTQEEIAAQAGLPLEKAVGIWRAAGFPDPGPDAAIFTEADAEMLRTFSEAELLLGEQATLQLTRVLATSLARIAEAAITALAVNRDAQLFDAGLSELELARSSTDNAALLPRLDEVMRNLLRRHLDAANNARFELAHPAPTSDVTDLAVGFADMVGFTALSQELPASELANVVSKFEGQAADLVVARGGRVVKTIGDEVMFVSGDAASGCETVLELLEAFEPDEVLPPLRGGLAAGEVLARDGDYYGPVVSLASRATRLARPNTVLVSQVVRDRVSTAGGPYRFKALSPRRLKGFEERLRLFALAR